MNEEEYNAGLTLVLQHMVKVSSNLSHIAYLIMTRAENHDRSKFSPEERPLVVNKSKLDNAEYMSDEYKRLLEENRIAIQHHYAHNRHHPEYFGSLIQMNLLDLLEMLCDWKVSSESNGSNIWDSLEINRKRYNIPDDVYLLLQNTCYDLGWTE